MQITLLQDQVFNRVQSAYDNALPKEEEPTYEEKLERLDEREMVELLVKNGGESLMLEFIINKLAKRFSELRKKRTRLNEQIKQLSLSKDPNDAVKQMALQGELKNIPNEMVDFYYNNLDPNYDFSKDLKELLIHNSIEPY